MKSNFKARSRHLFKILIVNFAILIGLLFALEAAVRALGIPTYGSFYPMISGDGYIRKHIPGAAYEYKLEGYSKGRFNSQGYLDRERSITKPEGVFRIAVLGDSITEGLQVDMRRNFCSRLEKELNKNYGPACEVLNFGVSGYATSDEYMLLKKEVMDYEPDLVILVFMALNDVPANYARLDEPNRRIYFNIVKGGNLIMDDSHYRAYLNSPEGMLRRLMDGKSRIFRMLLSLYRDCVVYKGYRQAFNSSAERNTSLPEAALFLKEIPADYRMAWRITEELLTEVKDHVESRDAKFILVSVPIGWQLLPSERWAKENPNSKRNKPEEILSEISGRRGIEYLNLLPVFLNNSERIKISPYFLVSASPAHLNEIGHKWAAEALFNYITTNYTKR